MHTWTFALIVSFCTIAPHTGGAAARTIVLWINGTEAQLTTENSEGPQPATSASLTYGLTNHLTHEIGASAHSGNIDATNRLSYATEDGRFRASLSHTISLTRHYESQLRASAEVTQPLEVGGKHLDTYARVEFAYSPAAAGVQTNATLGGAVTLPLGMGQSVNIAAQTEGSSVTGRPWCVNASVSIVGEVIDGVTLSGNLEASDVLAESDSVPLEATVAMTLQW